MKKRTGLLGLTLALLFVFSQNTFARSGTTSISKQPNGTTVLEVKDNWFAFYMYHWLKLATQKKFQDNRVEPIRTQYFYLNSYTTDGMDFVPSVKLYFDGKNNTIDTTKKPVVISGEIAYLLTQGAVVYETVQRDSVQIENGIYAGDFKVTAFDKLVCERTHVPDGPLVKNVARCFLGL